MGDINISSGSNIQYDNSQGSYKSYIIGFILSIILTIVPYMIVVNHLLTREIMVFVVVTIGVIQLLIQLVFFLHLGAESKPRWNLMAFLFTLFVVGVLVVGSLWIMYNLDYNMMDH